MKTSAILVVLSAVLILVTPILAVGCTDLQQGAEDTAITMSTVMGAPDSTLTESTSTTAATLPAVATTTTLPPAPAATTTTTSGGLHINPSQLHVSPSLMQIDPNMLITPTRYEDTHGFLLWEWEDVW